MKKESTPKTSDAVSYRSDETMKQQAFFLSREMIKRLKVQAVLEDRDMSAIAQDALRQYFTEHKLTDFATDF